MSHVVPTVMFSRSAENKISTNDIAGAAFSVVNCMERKRSKIQILLNFRAANSGKRSAEWFYV